MPKRSIYIWKLQQIVEAEGTVAKVVDKAKSARLSALWVKIADGPSPYRNITDMAPIFRQLIARCQAAGLEVWGWHVPRCPGPQAVMAETDTINEICSDFALDGLIMNAEPGPGFFQGDVAEADAYGRGMRAVASRIGRPLAISSHDIPGENSGWLPKFNKIALHADINYPQVYCGASPSMARRIRKAEAANSHIAISFCPVGAAWIGDAGGCPSASACAEQAQEFRRVVHDRGFAEYAFWHWAGAPPAFWEVLKTTPP